MSERTCRCVVLCGVVDGRAGAAPVFQVIYFEFLTILATYTAVGLIYSVRGSCD